MCSAFLAQIAETWSDEHLILVMDNGGYHRARRCGRRGRSSRGAPSRSGFRSMPQPHRRTVLRFLKQYLVCHRFWADVAGLEAAIGMVLDRIGPGFIRTIRQPFASFNTSVKSLRAVAGDSASSWDADDGTRPAGSARSLPLRYARSRSITKSLYASEVFPSEGSGAGWRGRGRPTEAAAVVFPELWSICAAADKRGAAGMTMDLGDDEVAGAMAEPSRLRLLL
jgi:hypothetical protein